ncbi:hypothetical protein FCT18_04220 [Lysinibacillus sphaericus]|uniref:Lipoprotein n=1 Tax=Lysinibacillus sphaericus TaxID=1421 RepID=A0A2S0JXY7_LYSSH|nr:hypothetical protein [Lysinibacillus sphaericus]AVK95995.1 hypothetical protein LS41612_06920 [Lysinibacillus sphaericus]MED4544731.1 hypothetical protein [Lysinibacillus sphaericus]TKI20851.1 hypothetical protein FCT18_04220 [Lysinibacillus sphaericus]SUV18249.1 Uncharacterised protein [Lysinibacillus sphaericus]GEC83594.1 hypothetical protein LSP03_33370 [Lysinibacillus sphaericus]
MIKIINSKLFIFILVMLTSIFVLVACDNNQQIEDTKRNNQQLEEKQNNHQQQQMEEVSSTVSLEKQFIPPNFGVDEFKVNANDKLVEFKISYRISPQLYDVLSKINSKYYFELKIPENISSIINKDSTGLVPGAIMEFNSLKYIVTLNTEVDKPLTTSEIKELVQNKNGYGLYVYDQDKDAIHYFDDVELFSTIPK